MANKKKKYVLTEEHKAMLAPWADKWIENALRTGAYSAADVEEARLALRGLYGAAGIEIPPVEREVFCQSPVTGAIAASVAAGVWWLRENPQRHKGLFGRDVSDAEIMSSIDAACRHAVKAGMSSIQESKDVLPAEIEIATVAAIRAARQACIRLDVKESPFVSNDVMGKGRDVGEVELGLVDDAGVDVITPFGEHGVSDHALLSSMSAGLDAARNQRASAEDDGEVAQFLIACLSGWANLRDGGNQWSGWVAYLSFFRHVAKLDVDWSKWQHYEAAAKFGPRYMHQRFWIVCDLPETIKLDERKRPHTPNGPYIRWSDGWAIWYWHGTRVPRQWIEDPESVDVSLALTWQNIEQRRALCEILGWKKVIDSLDAKTIDVDPNPQIGTLIEIDIPGSPGQRFLRVLCGTGREFVLPVPVTMQTAHQANAWTYSLETEEYDPEVRT